MTEEIDVPIDEVREKIHELQEEMENAKDKEAAREKEEAHSWTRFIALATAILAAVAAVAALQAGKLVNESLLAKNDEVGYLTKASDSWNYYQAEGLKSLIYKISAQALPPGSPAAAKDAALAKHYTEKQADLTKEATDLEEKAKASGETSERFIAKHEKFAYSVTLTQIAIALSAVAALTRRRRVWYIGLACGVGGIVLLIIGFS